MLLDVMLVDDERMALEHIRNMLDWEALGFHVVAMETNGRSAWEKYCSIRPQIVIADICMPIMDGLELSRLISGSGDNVRILLLSAHDDFSYAKSAIGCGVYRYLVKHELDRESIEAELAAAAADWRAEDCERGRRFGHAIERWLIAPRETGDGSDYSQLFKGNVLVCFICKSHTWQWSRPREAVQSGIPGHELAQHLQSLFRGSGCGVASLPGETAVLTQLPSTSERAMIEARHRVINQILVAVGETGSAPCTVNYEVLRGGSPAELHQIYKSCRTLSECAFLRGGAQSVSVCSIADEMQNIDPGLSMEKYSAKISAVTAAVEALDEAALGQTLDRLFSELLTPPLSYPNFIWVSEELLRMRRSTSWGKRSVLTKEDTDEAADREWHCASDFFGWIRERYMSAIFGGYGENVSSLSKRTALAVEYVKGHFREDISLDDAAKAAGLSRIYLSQLFRREIGKTLVEYVTELRIEAAKHMLESGGYKVCEVAASVGFKSTQYFSNVFRKVTGMSPLDWRDSR